MKKVITFVVAVAVGALGVAARPGGAAPAASAVARCDGGGPARSDMHTLAVGAGFAGADGTAISQTSPAGTEVVVPPDGGRGVVRHVSSRPGVGTAYVRDRKGGDLVVSVTGRGIRRFATRDEALQPSLSAQGDLVWAERSGLRLVPAGARTPTRIAGPTRGAVTFSPVFASRRTIVVAVAAPPTAAVPEDEYLSNLWRYDLRSSRWVRSTHFSGGPDRWSIVRTPFLAQDGSIQFVRVSGRASIDRAPRFELWQLRGDIAGEAATASGRDVPRRFRWLRSAVEPARGRDGSVADPAGASRWQFGRCRLRCRHGRPPRPRGSRRPVGKTKLVDRRSRRDDLLAGGRCDPRRGLLKRRRRE